MDDERLIESVRKYPVIYDTANIKYLDSKYKLQIWNKIGEEIQQTGSLCKSRWQNIRDQFRKNLAKTVSKSGQAAEKRKKYKYEDCLQFLIPFFAERDTVSNVQPPNSEDPDIPHQEIEHEGSQSQAIQPTIDISETVRQTEAENQPRPVIKRPSVPTKRKLPDQESASSTLMKYLLAKGDGQKTENVHPIDAFFSGLAATVKSFSPYYQHLAKGRIFNVVQELEAQQLPHPTVQNNLIIATPMSTPSPSGTSLDSTHTIHQCQPFQTEGQNQSSPAETSLDSTHTIHQFQPFQSYGQNQSTCNSTVSTFFHNFE